MITKPLLAVAADLDKLSLPVIGSPKLDGIRCIVLDGKALSRKLKPIPNVYIREWIEANCPNGFDGEIMLRDLSAPFKAVASAVMSHGGEPDFIYSVFDWVYKAEQDQIPFAVRVDNLKLWIQQVYTTRPGIADHLEMVPQQILYTREEVDTHHVAWVENGFEGSMIRDPQGVYKSGRSTQKQGILLKIKNWADEEAEVIGIIEQMENTNEKTVDEVGAAKRSTHAAGMVGKGTMGALECRFADGTEFKLGSGFNDEERQRIWDSYCEDRGTEHVHSESGCIGMTVKVKHQPDFGGRQKGQKPRFPGFLGFRNVEID